MCERVRCVSRDVDSVTLATASKLMGSYVQLIEAGFMKDLLKHSVVKKTTASALKAAGVAAERDAGGAISEARVWRLVDGMVRCFRVLVSE